MFKLERRGGRIIPFEFIDRAHDPHAPAFAGLQTDSFKAAQSFYGPVHGGIVKAYIKLNDLGAFS